MKSNKISTIFLLLIMIFTLTMSVGCGKENDEPKDNNKDKPGQVEGNENKDGVSGGKDKNDEKDKKPVKLLKRNGVEWKENTRIKSKKGDSEYTVVWGDTLSLIARTWKVNCYKLARYNGIKNIDRIEVGQVIRNYASQQN